MFKNPSAKDMVLLQNFVREPVDTICKNINNNFSKKIIITGGRGVGKTTILYNNELLGLGTDNQTIYMSFDAVGMNVLTPSKYFNEKFMIHYYEVIMSYKILNYIKNNYGLTYEKYFKKYEIIITKFLNNIDNYIEKSIYEKVYLKKYLNPGELS